MKSITIVIGVFGSGGGERNCFNLANNFSQRGIQVTVVMIGLKDKKYLSRFDSRVQIVDLGKRHLRSALIPLFLHIKNSKPSTVLAFNHYVAAGLQLVRMIPGINYRLYMRSIIGLTNKYQLNKSFWQTKIAAPLIRLLLRDLDGVISQCIDMEKDLIANWAINKKRSCVINNPVSSEVENEQEPYSPLGKKNYLLYVGRFAVEKRVDVLIRTLASLVKKDPTLRLVLLGEGELESELRALVKELGLEKNVDFAGFVDFPIPYYKEAKATVLASYSEGFPNVLIESLTLGTPVVAYDCETGPSEIIKNGVNGFLVPLGDESCFKDSVQRALIKDWSFEVSEYKQAPIVEKYLNFLF